MKLIIRLKWLLIVLLVGGMAAYFFMVTWQEVAGKKFYDPRLHQDALGDLVMTIILAGIPAALFGVPLLMLLRHFLFTDDERIFEKVQELRRREGLPPAAVPPARKTD